MRQIVFINQNSGYLMVDIINAYGAAYDDKILITGKLIERNNKLESKVKVEKIIAYDRSTAIRRIATWGWAFIKILFLVKTRYRKADLFITSNPPFATILPLFCRNRFHLFILDVYPDALVEYKIFSGDSFLIRMWRKANKKIFSKAAAIFTISDGMRDLLSSYVAPDKIKVVPIWTDNTFLRPLPKSENVFIRTHNLDGKFLVIYSGNIGYTHDLEALLHVANRMQKMNVYFVIIGEGEKKAKLVAEMNSRQLKNILFLPWQPVNVLPYSLAAADIGVVSLGKEASLLSVPSKTYNLMSVRVPLLCIASKDSELARVTSRYNIGRCFDAAAIDDMVAYISDLMNNRDIYNHLADNALAASAHFDVRNAKEFVVSPQT